MVLGMEVVMAQSISVNHADISDAFSSGNVADADRLNMPPAPGVNPQYDAWFIAQVDKGLEDLRNGKFVTNEEVEREVAERRARLLAMSASR